MSIDRRGQEGLLDRTWGAYHTGVDRKNEPELMSDGSHSLS